MSKKTNPLNPPDHSTRCEASQDVSPPQDQHMPSEQASDEESPCYQRAVNMMRQNRKTARLAENLQSEMVVHVDTYGEFHLRRDHFFTSEDVGVVDTMVFLGTVHVDRLEFLQFEIVDIPSPQKVIIKPISAGMLYRPSERPQGAPYVFDEYPLDNVGNITFWSRASINEGMIKRCDWYTDHYFEKLSYLFLGFQDWAYMACDCPYDGANMEPEKEKEVMKWREDQKSVKERLLEIKQRVSA